MGDSHGHVTSAAGKNKKNLAIVFGLTLFYLVVEVVGGFWTGSLALLADGGHMLTDVVGVGGRGFIKPLVIGLENRHNVLVGLATSPVAAWLR